MQPIGAVFRAADNVVMETQIVPFDAEWMPLTASYDSEYIAKFKDSVQPFIINAADFAKDKLSKFPLCDWSRRLFARASLMAA